MAANAEYTETEVNQGDNGIADIDTVVKSADAALEDIIQIVKMVSEEIKNTPEGKEPPLPPSPEDLMSHMNTHHSNITRAFPLVVTSIAHGDYNSAMFRRYLIKYADELAAACADTSSTAELRQCKVHAEYAIMISGLKTDADKRKLRRSIVNALLDDRANARKMREKFDKELKRSAIEEKIKRREALRDMIAGLKSPEQRD
jgi:hypothetical protein